MNWRSVIVICFLSLISGLIGYLFWRQEWQYSRPTPVPVDYQIVRVNKKIDLPDFVSFRKQPIYLHFYNPDCPCSLFNAQHVRQLIFSHGDSIRAIIVVPSSSDLQKAKNEFGNHLEVIADSNGLLAKACGVYSTPQAVIIDKNGNLYYRGNYNRARYCTAQATNYGELALLNLIKGNPPPVFDLLATQSYGCQLANEKLTTSLKLF